jgi:RNAse (barnase) inhibitor barstar
VVGTLLGVLVGGWITTRTKRIELEFQAERERTKLILGKIEHIYTKASEYLITTTRFNDVLIELRNKSEFTKKEFIFPILEDFRTITEIDTLVRLYTPELEKNWDSVTDEINKFHEIAFKYVTEKTITYNEVNDVCNRIFDKIGEFLERLVALSREYTEIKEPKKKLTRKS